MPKSVRFILESMQQKLMFLCVRTTNLIKKKFQSEMKYHSVKWKTLHNIIHVQVLNIAFSIVQTEAGKPYPVSTFIKFVLHSYIPNPTFDGKFFKNIYTGISSYIICLMKMPNMPGVLVLVLV